MSEQARSAEDGEMETFRPPLLPEQGLPTLRVAYSDRTAVVMAKFAHLAYVRFEDGPEQEAVLERLLNEAGFTLIRAYKGEKPDGYRRDWGTQAYIAGNDDFNVLVFRGTTDFRDWRTNLNAFRRRIRVGQNALKVHSGFYQAFRYCAGPVFFDLETHPALRGKPLYITGHSLGGALAQIATAAFARDNIAACYTFGAPRVGDKHFDKIVKPPHYRVTHNLDIVPGIPPRLLGYQHGGDARHIALRPLELLRRDVLQLQRIFMDVVGLFGALFSREWKGVGDHAMDQYIARLEDIAATRSSLTTQESEDARNVFGFAEIAEAAARVGAAAGVAGAAIAAGARAVGAAAEMVETALEDSGVLASVEETRAEPRPAPAAAAPDAASTGTGGGADGPGKKPTSLYDEARPDMSEEADTGFDIDDERG